MSARRRPSPLLLLGLVLGRRARDERGQALPLAAVGILMMCLGVIVTLNLGQAVHEKIRLQNNADAAAYSLAAMEARTFNYIAFLNRVQIAHYNTAAAIQSYTSYVGYWVAAYAQAADMVISLNGANDLGINTNSECPTGIRCLYEAVTGVLHPAATTAEQLRDKVVDAYKKSDELAHQLVQAMAMFNKGAVWQAQLARAAMLNAHISTGMAQFISDNDDEMTFDATNAGDWLQTVLNGVLNSVEYYKAFDKSAGVNPLWTSLPGDMGQLQAQGGYPRPNQAEEAYKVMSELINASRSPDFVTARTGNGTVVGMFGIPSTFDASKRGSTKFIQDGGPVNSPQISQIHDGGKHTMGANLASDDFTTGGFSTLNVGSPATVILTDATLGSAIASYTDNGQPRMSHLFYDGCADKNCGSGEPGGVQGGYAGGSMQVLLIPGPGRAEQAGSERHRGSSLGSGGWPGFAPFFKFNASGDRTADYNQPSTWFFLNKHHSRFQQGTPWHFGGQDYSGFGTVRHSRWGGGSGGRRLFGGRYVADKNEQTSPGGSARLDTTIGGPDNSFLFEGLNVVSRGMAYYHRPDSSSQRRWAEPPNFFNPYWRARLAPIGQKLQQFWERYVTNSVGTPEGAVPAALVNLVRNTAADMLTEVVTALVTH